MVNAAKKTRQYENKNAYNRQRQQDISRKGRDCGPLPPINDPARRAASCASLRVFCESYLREASGTNESVFNLEWSEDQLKVIASIEATIESGGLRSIAMPRSSGKTRICCAGILWAILTGKCRSVLLVAATNPMAKRIFRLFIKPEFQANAMLLADFPELHCIWKLERNTRRADGQTLDGKPTNIVITSESLKLAEIDGVASSGASITCAGITSGNIRGGRYDLILIDDPVTDAAARSKPQRKQREEIILKVILPLAYPGRKLSCLMTVTIIEEGDLAERFTDHSIRPEWMGQRMKMFWSFPKNEKLWDEYHEIQVARQQAGDPSTAKENEFYAAHREAMDEGAKVAWQARYNRETELSAIQSAMNLKFKVGDEAFAAEYQNEPLKPETTVALLDEKGLIAKIDKSRPRGIVPDEADVLVAFVDSHDYLLYYSVGAFKRDGFTGWLVDYGTLPDQKRSYFTHRNAKIKLASVVPPGTGKDGVLHAGIIKLLDDLLTRQYKRQDKTVVHIQKILIDCGDEQQIVLSGIGNCRSPQNVLPSKGYAIGPDATPISEWRRQKGDRCGLDWKIPVAKGTARLRVVNADTNAWKTRLANALATALLDKGCFSFPASKDGNRLLIEHCLSERPTPVFARGRTVNKWKALPGRDNHYWDCLVGMMVAASIEGCQTVGGAVRKRLALPAPASYMTTAEQFEPVVSSQKQPIKRREVPVANISAHVPVEAYYPFG